MDIHIVAGGPLEHVPSLTAYHHDKCRWIGVDRGVMTLLSHQIRPYRAFGDFDSVSEAELKELHEQWDLAVYPSAKNETDSELAIDWAISQGPRCIRLFAATGGRLDHFLANIQLMKRIIDFGIDVELIDRQNVVTMKRPGRHIITEKAGYRYVSFIPFSDEVEGIVLENFRYPLDGYTLSSGSTRCVSNELLDESGAISFEAGICLIIQSKDA